MSRIFAGEAKYVKWNKAKDTTLVDLLMKDDERKFLSTQQREFYLERVSKKYNAAKKKNQPIEEAANELLKKFEEKNKDLKIINSIKVT